MSIVSNQSANIKRDREPGDRFGPRVTAHAATMNHDTDDEPGRSSGPGDDVIEVEHPEKQPRGHRDLVASVISAGNAVMPSWRRRGQAVVARSAQILSE
jgi:hypothetical protein